MKIDAIHRGIVLDHIKAGRAMDIYRYLHLDELQCPVAIIKNARSEAMGLKDIIKIDDEIDIDLDVVGFVDPGTTVNVIKDGVVVDYINLLFMRFAVFNFADICVCVGVALWVLVIFLDEVHADDAASKEQ